MNCENNFSYYHLKRIYENILDRGYSIVSCKDYFYNYEGYKNMKIFINRVDVDLSLSKAIKISNIFKELNITGTFFIRLHAPEYNPLSYDNYLRIKELQKYYEIGLHSEVIDCGNIFNKNYSECLISDIKILETILGSKFYGLASHGGLTGYNNLDFWKNNNPNNFNLMYEAYDRSLFDNCFYTSVLLLSGWKCYNKGNLIEDDKRCLCEHIKDDHRLMYNVIHPIKFYERHVYED